MALILRKGKASFSVNNTDKSERSFRVRWRINYKQYKYVYLMLVPVVLFYLIFHYIPMAGSVIAFQEYIPAKGFLGSKWVGFMHFKDFLTGPFAWRIIRNTLLLNIYQIVFGFPAPIFLALFINEVKNAPFRKVAQTVSYMPHFISLVVVCGMLMTFSRTDGIFNQFLGAFGFEASNLLSRSDMFRGIYTASGIWQGIGWGSIIYLATLTSVDPCLYEAASIDGARRFSRMIHVSVPALMPIIIVQLIMRLGNIMTQGFEKVILLYSPAIYETADIISSYVYRRGLEQMDYSFGSAVGIFNSVVNLITLVLANYFSRKTMNESLW